MAEPSPTGGASTTKADSFQVAIVARPTETLGLKVDAANVIVKVAPGGVAAADGRLRVGDRILALNDHALGDGFSLADVLQRVHAIIQQPQESDDPDAAAAAAAADGLVYRFEVTHARAAGSRSEKMLALVMQEKSRRHDKALAQERAKAVKKESALAARDRAEAEVAAAAAAALRASLRRASQYRMPVLEEVLARLLDLAATSTEHPQTSEPRADAGALSCAERRAKSPRRAAAKESGASATHVCGAGMAAGQVAEVASETKGAPRGGCAIFVHFIPPPLRAEGKRELPWIVHSCDGSGCHEARHVSFHSMTGFATHEGTPPEVAEGTSCGCQTIANHHLRGFGTVRWEGQHAIVEDEAEESVLALADRRAYVLKAKKLAMQVKELQQKLAAVDAANSPAVLRA